MAIKHSFYTPVLLILCQMMYEAAATQRCSVTETSIYGMMLRRHIFKTIAGASRGDVCLLECYRDIRCQSYNYVISKRMCELNDRTKEARPEDFIPASHRYYFRRDKDRVILGSIPELPAESCKEIKASEGEEAASGKYWFDSIIPGRTVLAHCDMNKRAENCGELYKFGERVNGVYTIDPDSKGAFDVFCDQTTSGGGWTVLQRRLDGSVDFFRDWADYKSGFGNLTGEFWLGLGKINNLTRSGKHKLRVELEDTEGNAAYAEYDVFVVANEETNYRLSVGNYSGNAGDSLTNHDGYPFTTKDQDNDQSFNHNCAVIQKGAWWYKKCHTANLNGFYHLGNYSGGWADGVVWKTWKGIWYSAKTTEMKIRPLDF
ncbi:microfibril-associated glycoprotein 4-like [Oculina patagonica]